MRRNDADILTLWVATWTWRDATDLTEMVFAYDKQLCANIIRERIGIAAQTLRELWIVQPPANARAHVKFSDAVEVNVFERAMRKPIAEVLPQLQARGFGIWRQPTYQRMLDIADEFEQ